MMSPAAVKTQKLFEGCEYDKEYLKKIMAKENDFKENFEYSRQLVWLMKLYNDGEDLISTNYETTIDGLNVKTSVFAMVAYNSDKANKIKEFNETVGGIANNKLGKPAFIHKTTKKDEKEFIDRIDRATSDFLDHYWKKGKKGEYEIKLRDLLLRNSKK